MAAVPRGVEQGSAGACDVGILIGDCEIWVARCALSYSMYAVFPDPNRCQWGAIWQEKRPVTGRSQADGGVNNQRRARGPYVSSMILAVALIRISVGFAAESNWET